VRSASRIASTNPSVRLVTVKTAGPPMGSVTLPAARLYLLDENNKIKSEQVIFYAVPD